MAKEKKEHVYTPRDPAVVSFTMSHIRGKDTGIELKLRKALYEKGFRYRCNSSRVFGHPDIVSQKHKLAIFCDSEFWHGYHFEEAKKNLHSHLDYWIPKIEKNMERDVLVNEELKRQGYTVLRYWGFEIEKELDRVVDDVMSHVKTLEEVDAMRKKGLVKTTLCYLERDDKYLMLHRIKEEGDVNAGKWIGVGGHFEEGENARQCAIREVKEETGLTLTKLRYCGYVDFLNSEYPPERMYVFKGLSWHGEMIECDEGVLEWVEKKDVLSLPLWEGDRIFLPLLEKDGSPFRLTLLYHGDSLKAAFGPAYPPRPKKKTKKKRRALPKGKQSSKLSS